MKIRHLKLTAIALLLVLCLASCGSVGSSFRSDYKSEPQAMEAESSYDYSYGFNSSPSYAASKDSSGSYSYSEESSQSYDPSKVKLIYRANIDIQATDFDATVEAIQKLVAEYGGYFESSSVYNGGYYSDGTYKHGNYTVRIPSENYSAFLGAVGDSCYVSNKSESVEDIGLQYADTEAMLETLRIKQQRLQDLLKEASGLSDIIQLENALSDTEYQINRYSSTMNRYDSLIGYATVNISVEKVNRAADGIDEDEGYLSRLFRSFTSGVNDFVDNIGDFVIDLAYNIIPLAIAALVLALLFKKGFFGGVARWFRERNTRAAERRAEKKSYKQAKSAKSDAAMKSEASVKSDASANSDASMKSDAAADGAAPAADGAEENASSPDGEKH